MVKNLPAIRETWVGKVPWRKAWQPTPVFLPRESPWTEEPDGLPSMEAHPILEGRPQDLGRKAQA